MSDSAYTVKGLLQYLIDNGLNIGQTREVVFHDESIIAGNGVDIEIIENSNLTIFISGTSTSRNISFKLIDFDGNVYDVVGFKNGDVNFSYNIFTTGNSESWNFENIKGFKYFRVVINSLAGGNVTVKGVLFNGS
jgi:hypothetical protein